MAILHNHTFAQEEKTAAEELEKIMTKDLAKHYGEW